MRAIGVSTPLRHLDALLEKADTPMVDQTNCTRHAPGRNGRVLSGAGHSRRGVGPVSPGRLFERSNWTLLAAKHRKSVSQIVSDGTANGASAAAEVHHAVANRRERATVRLRTQPAGDEFHHAHKMRKFGTRPGRSDVTPSHRARPYADTGSPASAYVFTVRPVLLPRHPAGKLFADDQLQLVGLGTHDLQEIQAARDTNDTS